MNWLWIAKMEKVLRSQHGNRGFLLILMPRTIDMFQQDTGFDVGELSDGRYKSKEWRDEGKKIFQPMYTKLLNWVYERSEYPEFGDYRKEEARFVRDTVFMECMKIWDVDKAEKED